jgi:hypothetical protein
MAAQEPQGIIKLAVVAVQVRLVETLTPELLLLLEMAA